MYRERMLRKGFYPALTHARLRRVTFHSLRHSCASAMIAADAPSRRFSTISVTPIHRSPSPSTRTGSRTPTAAVPSTNSRQRFWECPPLLPVRRRSGQLVGTPAIEISARERR
jgi:integrase